MVHIKKLEVYGFKSFGFRNTIVQFEKGLVAITGPNGSGKSNILDAIMFAIGENSPKAMRVDKFQSLFHDANNPGHRLIRVSVTFDNADRGIPMDEDAVTLTREMEGQSGESQYLLNGKKVSKTAIMELLEVVLSAPNKLNIVQQGMITRISELNSEERRKIIEDIVGLSYFDEKKAEALKQLDEADRRLEVAFARMGEIRKRIDELEAERNDQLRYEQIGSELKRFKAVQLSNNIRMVRSKLATSTQILEGNNQRSAQLTKQLDELRQEIEGLETEKAKFMEEVDAANKAKAQLASRTAAIVHDSERTKAMLGESQRRISDIERRLPQIEGGKQAIAQRAEGMKADAERLQASVAQKKEALAALRARLDQVNTKVEEVSAVISRYAGLRQKLEGRAKRVSSLRNSIEMSAARMEEKIKTNTYKKDAGDLALASLASEVDSAKTRMAELQKSLESDRSRLQETVNTLDALAETKTALERELAGSAAILSKADTMATKFEERASVAKHAMNEDFAIAELSKYSEKFGIKGIVHDLVRWDKSYERAVLAAGSEWMKAFVVEDVKSMIAIAAYAKEKKLPRLRIIPLDIVGRYRPRPTKEFRGDTNVVGRVSDFVYSEYEALPEFLFSDAIVVRNSSAAYMLARQGFRAVSVEGELFEPAGGSMALDFGSKISDLTKAIILGDSVESLRDMLGRLSKAVEKKNAQLREAAERIASAESEKIRLEIQISSNETRLAEESASVAGKEKTLPEMQAQGQALAQEAEALAVELGKYRRRLELILPTIERLSARLQGIDESAAKAQLAEINVERNQIVKQADSANIELSQISSSLGGIESRLEFDQRQLAQLEEEKERLTMELDQRKKQTEEMRIKAQSLETELKALRDQEQQIIDSSGNAYSVLQEYERKIKGLSEEERKVSKENNIIERESALLRKDVADLTAQESRLVNDLVWLGYKSLLDPMDVEGAIKELSDEYEQVKSRINLRADESYVQVMEGYRGMSTRRNQLESERNSIVSFIEQIVKEKKEMFMDAFGKVDSDIRTTFSKLTGGNARLELENPEDVFAGGVMLLVAFPGKVARESTALSGGEKTIAATVFLLALQSLKPSPFYLMDEVDAHLDAQNTDRLSKILVERSKDNQIIMVTLKDSTVAKATLIYGVYPRQGVSQVVKYRNPGQVPLAQINSSTAEGN
ncbi:chromosome segregation SMC family protein [Nitrososphaera viennensis]|uniref:Chromosome segregation protein SMC n=2 Tax=Nitrososphaera viennensis TaxID=1034015 RepID=A0A060HLQ4_9ARCH|nr:chromosome segregation SMC family protein [Nitrososphaera viennensis]AIC14516.1 chromosome segregation protein SMC [Nitrososphaera viennensis EN76]UVS69489.1 chromosome segregation protein SMC [Nitrososphaera viennensis]